MTQDVCMGWKAPDPGAVAALEEALGNWEVDVPDQPPEARNGY
jgi:hypothetical protein